MSSAYMVGFFVNNQKPQTNFQIDTWSVDAENVENHSYMQLNYHFNHLEILIKGICL